MGIERLFWPKVDIRGPEDCWEWTACLTQDGYGQLRSAPQYGYSRKASRISWNLSYGVIPEGLQVCHKCDNRKCVNPLHLFLGTAKENQWDKVKKGRQAKGEKAGKLKLTEEQVKSILSDGRKAKDLSKEFKVSVVMIGLIKRKKSWKYLSDSL